jgi:hypothetical protein
MRLEPWGRIEGTVRTRDQQWVNRKVSWHRTGNLTSWATLFYRSGSFSTLTDFSGRFVLERVPPGDCRVAILETNGSTSALSPLVQVPPGQTVQVELGRNGRNVTGRLAAPEDVEIQNWSEQLHTADLSDRYDDYHVPAGLSASDSERWKLEFEDTEAGRSWFGKRCSYRFTVASDGSFTIPDVLPGTYDLFITFRQGNLGSGVAPARFSPAAPQIASAHRSVTVPDISETDKTEIDLGAILLVPIKSP